MQAPILVEAAYAIGIGLVIGLEREHSEATVAEDGAAVDSTTGEPVTPPRPTAMGARTMALLGLVGWLLAYLGDRDPWMLPAGLITVVALIGVQMYMGREIGMTTEVAGVVAVLLGALVHLDRSLAVALSLATIGLLVSKPWMRQFVGHLRRIEITATLQLLLMVAIVLPLLPSEAKDPWGALPPRKVGTFIALIAGVQYVGYVLTRLLGPTRGVGLAGLVGGLTSSTAVTVSMARAARATPELEAPSLLATFLANTVMPIRVAVIAAAVSPTLGWRIGAAMGAMAVVLLVASFATWRRIRRAPPAPRTAVKLKNPFELWGALTWGAVLCAVLLGAKLATRWLGESGFLVAAGLSGITDVDAITLAAAEHSRSGVLGPEVAALAITIAVGVNQVVKGIMSWLGGGRRFGRATALVFAIAIVAGLAASLAVTLRG